jgi:hypothetical protein
MQYQRRYNDEESISRASSDDNTEDTIHREKTTVPARSPEINTEKSAPLKGIQLNSVG